jgi:hypothetical protein
MRLHIGTVHGHSVVVVLTAHTLAAACQARPLLRDRSALCTEPSTQLQTDPYYPYVRLWALEVLWAPMASFLQTGHPFNHPDDA